MTIARNSLRSEVGFWQVPPLFALATMPGTKTRKGELKRKNKLSRGVCRDGSVTLMCAQRSSTTTDLVLPRPGFLLIDVTRFLSQP